MSSAAYLRAFGSYVPEHLVDNAALAARTGRTAEAIEKTTGILARRYAPPDQSIADLGLAAAQDCLTRAGVEASAVGLILFGDGAGACLISRDSGFARIADLALYTDGNFAESLTLAHGGTLAMRGLEVIMQASRKVPRAIADLLAKNNVAADDVQVFLMHQANRNLLAKIAKELKVPEDRFFTNIASFGNTSSASLLIAAAQWSDAASVTGPVVFAAFGAGLQWGALLAVPVAS